MRLPPAQSRRWHKHTQCLFSGCRRHVGRQASGSMHPWIPMQGAEVAHLGAAHLVKLVPLPAKLCQLKTDAGSLAAGTGCHGFGCCWRPSTASCCTAVCCSKVGPLASCSCARGRVPVKHRLSSSAQPVRLPHVLKQHALQLQGLALCSYKAICIAGLLTQLGQQQPPAVPSMTKDDHQHRLRQSAAWSLPLHCHQPLTFQRPGPVPLGLCPSPPPPAPCAPPSTCPAGWWRGAPGLASAAGGPASAAAPACLGRCGSPCASPRRASCSQPVTVGSLRCALPCLRRSRLMQAAGGQPAGGLMHTYLLQWSMARL